MEEKELDIFIIDEENKKYMIQIPKKISASDLFLKIQKELDIYDFDILYHNKLYTEDNEKEILSLSQGDKIYMIKNKNEEIGLFAKFHLNENLDEEDKSVVKLSGILKLCLLRQIAITITDINKIDSNIIKDIILELQKGMEFQDEPQKDIKANLSEKMGNNIISYINFIDTIVDETIINNLINLFDKHKKNEIMSFWSILSKYQTFNELFEKDFLKAIKESYFDYSLIGVSIYQQEKRKLFIEELNKCPNKEVKFLFHGTQIDPISKIITGGFLYTKRAFYGMGIYFSDMLDYVSFYSGGNDEESRRDNFGKILPINTTFSCVAAETYYNKNLKKNVFDFRYYLPDFDHFPTYEEIKDNYPDKMVEKNGVYFVRVEPENGQVLTSENSFNIEKGKFVGTEYVITEMDQILPLYGLTLKRNEYFVIWKDPNFKGQNYYSQYLNERKMFMYKYAKVNAYFESSTEKALELIKRKKFNKIILISNIGLDLSGKKFVEIARKILGFDVLVLFFSSNYQHLQWIQNFPNALYTDDANFYRDYIINYNENGLINLKKQIEQNYGINLKFTKDFLKFPKFINTECYKDLIFEESSENFKKVLIKNALKNSFLTVNEDRKVSFIPLGDKEIDSFIWYVTIIDGEITLFSNDSYLGVNDENQEVNGEEFMKRWKYKKIEEDKYIIYYYNENKILTAEGNKAIIKEELTNKENQIFKLIEDN